MGQVNPLGCLTRMIQGGSMEDINHYETIRMAEIVKLLKVSESTIRRLQKRKYDPFPKPHDFGEGSNVAAYLRVEVIAWLERQFCQQKTA